MSEPIPIRRPIRWTALRADEAEKVIREWSRDEARIIFTDHTFDRLDERSEIEVIDTPTVIRILQTGQVFGDAVRNEHGHWQATMMARMPGGRHACAVTVIVRENQTLIVRTAMWKDLGS
jgi:hypothetical protein